MQYCGLVEVAGKGLLARLVPEYSTASIRADGPPKKRPRQQRPFGHTPRAVLSAYLVKAEQHERPQVDQRKQAKRVGEGEEGVEGHKYYVGALAVLNSRDKVHTPQCRHLAYCGNSL